MEAKLEKVMENVLRSPNVTGIMFTDEKGFCVGTRGTCSMLMSGGISRVAELTAKLDPDGKTPTMIQLENDSRQLLIQQRHNLTGTVMKTRSAEPIV